MDHYIVVFIISLYILIFDKLGLWKVVISFVGSEPNTHLFLVTYLIINTVFFSIGLIFTHFDLKTINTDQFKKVQNQIRLYNVAYQVYKIQIVLIQIIHYIISIFRMIQFAHYLCSDIRFSLEPILH